MTRSRSPLSRNPMSTSDSSQLPTASISTFIPINDDSATVNYRWSDIVPPENGLTFAIVWDPQEDMLAFSGAEIAAVGIDDSRSFLPPSDAKSEAFTMCPSMSRATLEILAEHHAHLFTREDRTQIARTQTSSTLGELDVYARGSLMEQAHGNYRHYSFLDKFDDGFNLDPLTCFAKSWVKDGRDGGDSGFFEADTSRKKRSDAPRPPLSPDRPSRSRSSTATSEFVKVSLEDAASANLLLTLESPEPLPRPFSDSNSPQHGRRLRKRRPADIPAPPSEVLRRQNYNHTTPPRRSLPLLPPTCSSSSQSSKALHKLVRGLGQCRKSDGGDLGSDRWVCVEI